MRAGPRLIIDGEPSLRVVGEASDGLQVLDLARKRAPDVVLLEIRLPAMDGLTAARRIIDETRCRVLLITTLSSDEQVFEGLRLRDRVQAVVLAYESGLVTPDLLSCCPAAPRQAPASCVNAVTIPTWSRP